MAGTFGITFPDSFFTLEKYVSLFPEKDLNGGGAATLVENLSNYRDAVQLTVRPYGTPGTGSGDGTIALVYSVGGGADQTHTWTFTGGAFTTEQTFTLPADAEVKSVTASANWNAGSYDILANITYQTLHNPELNRPGRLRVKYTGTGVFQPYAPYPGRAACGVGFRGHASLERRHPFGCGRTHNEVFPQNR